LITLLSLVKSWNTERKPREEILSIFLVLFQYIFIALYKKYFIGIVRENLKKKNSLSIDLLSSSRIVMVYVEKKVKRVKGIEFNVIIFVDLIVGYCVDYRIF